MEHNYYKTPDGAIHTTPRAAGCAIISYKDTVIDGDWHICDTIFSDEFVSPQSLEKGKDYLNSLSKVKETDICISNVVPDGHQAEATYIMKEYCSDIEIAVDVPEENMQEEVQPVEPQTDYAAEKVALVRNINQLTELYNASQCAINDLQAQLKDATERYNNLQQSLLQMIADQNIPYTEGTSITYAIKQLLVQRLSESNTLNAIEYKLSQIAISGDTALDKISNLEQTCIKHVQNNVKFSNALSRVGFKADTSVDNNILEGIEWLMAHCYQNEEAWEAIKETGVITGSLANGIKSLYKSCSNLRKTSGNILNNDPHDIEVKGLKEELSHKQRTIEAFIALIDKL
jgi:hypothetical protein